MFKLNLLINFRWSKTIDGRHSNK